HKRYRLAGAKTALRLRLHSRCSRPNRDHTGQNGDRSEIPVFVIGSEPAARQKIRRSEPDWRRDSRALSLGSACTRVRLDLEFATYLAFDFICPAQAPRSPQKR